MPIFAGVSRRNQNHHPLLARGGSTSIFGGDSLLFNPFSAHRPELGPPDGPFSLERGLFMDENKDIARATIRLVEARLRQYPVDKKLVEAWEKEKEEVAGALQSSSGHYGEILRGSGLKSDPTFSKVVRLERMAARIDEAKWYVEAIDDVLNALPDLERRLIEMKYFKAVPDMRIMNDLHISSSKYYAIRRKILLLLARRMGL